MERDSSRAAGERDALYEVAYEEAVRALSDQRAVIDSLRTRAGLLLSAAAITTSFLGAQALGTGQSSAFSWLALAAFVGLAVISLAILWPRRWEFATDQRDLIRSYIDAEVSAPIELLHRELSLHMDDSYLESWEGFGQLAALFQLASGLLVIEVTLWGHRHRIDRLDWSFMAKTPLSTASRPRPEPERPSPMRADPGFSLRFLLPKRLRKRWASDLSPYLNRHG
jgi:hypothetical protein